MARQSQAERNRKQRDRQRELRTRLKAERRPDRDDIARVMLHWFILGSVNKGRTHELERSEHVIVRRLVAQGFDEAACYDAFDRLVEKYTGGHWGFRRKPHLLFPDGSDYDRSD